MNFMYQYSINSFVFLIGFAILHCRKITDDTQIVSIIIWLSSNARIGLTGGTITILHKIALNYMGFYRGFTVFTDAYHKLGQIVIKCGQTSSLCDVVLLIFVPLLGTIRENYSQKTKVEGDDGR